MISTGIATSLYRQNLVVHHRLHFLRKSPVTRTVCGKIWSALGPQYL